MKFGITIPRALIQVANPEPYAALYDYIIEAEELGYDFAAIGHHRFSPETAFGEPSAPFVMLAALLARTGNIRMCSSIALVATYHPLDVAEQVNTLAELSNGRFIFGVGLGYRPYEFEAVEIDYKTRGERYDECLQIVEKAMTGEEFSFHGKHFNIPPVVVTPPPVPGKKTPLWMGSNAEAGIRRAAARADGWIIGFPAHVGETEARVKRYRAMAAENGREATLCLMRDFHIAPSREKMDPNWLANSIAINRQYQKAGSKAEHDDLSQRVLAGEQVSLDQFVPGRAVAGSPDDCIREVARARDTLGCEYMMLTPVGVPDPAQQMRELRLFARKVMPHFTD